MLQGHRPFALRPRRASEQSKEAYTKLKTGARRPRILESTTSRQDRFGDLSLKTIAALRPCRSRLLASRGPDGQVAVGSRRAADAFPPQARRDEVEQARTSRLSFEAAETCPSRSRPLREALKDIRRLTFAHNLTMHQNVAFVRQIDVRFKLISEYPAGGTPPLLPG